MLANFQWMGHWCGLIIFSLLILLIVNFFLIALLRRNGRGSRYRRPQGWDGKQEDKTKSSLESLKERCVKGEITREEFNRMKKVIMNYW